MRLSSLLIVSFVLISVPVLNGCMISAVVAAKAAKNAQETKAAGDKSNEGSKIANPASVNCNDKGGELGIIKGPGGGEYGVCTFRDGKKCEEWALYRGECPQGGVDISAIKTAQGVYCAITGNAYDAQKDLCTLKNAATCPAVDFYEGRCPKTPGK